MNAMEVRCVVRRFWVVGIAILGLSLGSCHTAPIEGWSGRSRTMILTSGPTEISLSSSRVPGYWAEQTDPMTGAIQEFFLYTRSRAYDKGTRVRVEGPYGPASPDIVRDETGVYNRGGYITTYILVVWKIEKSGNASRP